MAWFPLVGTCIGLVLAITAFALSHLLPIHVVSVLLLIVWVWLSGMLHLDGFCDCCDGLFVAASSERRLEILKDSRVGAYGVTGTVLLLLTKYVLLDTWLQQTDSLLPLIGIPALGRWVMVLAARFFPYARREGMGGYFRQGLGWLQVIIATGTVLGVLLITVPLRHLFVSVGVILLFLVGFGKWASQRLGGGITGDVYGAINECVEVLCLLIAVTWGSLSG